MADFEQVEELKNSIQSLVSYHRSFPNVEWSLSEQELKQINKLYLLLEPLLAES